jgi:hypothetical protein
LLFDLSAPSILFSWADRRTPSRPNPEARRRPWCAPPNNAYLPQDSHSAIVIRLKTLPIALASFFVIILLPALPAWAASPDAVDKLTTYAVMLGRATVCVDPAESKPVAARVANWIDRNFHGEDRAAYLLVFMQGMDMNARAQGEGRSPDSCAVVAREFRLFPWP